MMIVDPAKMFDFAIVLVFDQCGWLKPLYV